MVSLKMCLQPELVAQKVEKHLVKVSKKAPETGGFKKNRLLSQSTRYGERGKSTFFIINIQ